MRPNVRMDRIDEDATGTCAVVRVPHDHIDDTHGFMRACVAAEHNCSNRRCPLIPQDSRWFGEV